MSTRVPFDGDVVSEVLVDLRSLYLHRSHVYPVVYVGLAATSLAIGIASSERSSLVFFTLAAAGYMYIGFLRPRVAWHQNESAWREVLGLHFTGTVSDDDVWVCGTPERVAWKYFIAGKQSKNAVLLYASRADILPFHQSFFRDDSDWERFVALAKQKVPKWSSGG